jgi:hypothetical protein
MAWARRISAVVATLLERRWAPTVLLCRYPAIANPGFQHPSGPFERLTLLELLPQAGVSERGKALTSAVSPAGKYAELFNFPGTHTSAKLNVLYHARRWRHRTTAYHHRRLKGGSDCDRLTPCTSAAPKEEPISQSRTRSCYLQRLRYWMETTALKNWL